MGMEVFLQKEPKIPGAHKIGAAFPALELRAKHFTDMKLFLNLGPFRKTWPNIFRPCSVHSWTL